MSTNMQEQGEQVVFTNEDGEKLSFYVVEQTMISGVNYLLVTDSEEEEADAFLLKEISSQKDGELMYDMVEDETELMAVSKVFEELLEDVSIEYEK